MELEQAKQVPPLMYWLLLQEQLVAEKRVNVFWHNVQTVLEEHDAQLVMALEQA